MSEKLIKDFNVALEIKDIIKDNRIQLNKLSNFIKAAPDFSEAKNQLNDSERCAKNRIEWLFDLQEGEKGSAAKNYDNVISKLKTIFTDPKKTTILQKYDKHINLGEIMGIILKESSGRDIIGKNGEKGMFQYKPSTINELVGRLGLDTTDTTFCGLVNWLDFKNRRMEILFKRIPGCNNWDEGEKKAFIHRVYNRGSIMIALLGKIYKENRNQPISFAHYENAWQEFENGGQISRDQIDPGIVESFKLKEAIYEINAVGWDIGNRYSYEIDQHTQRFQ